MIALQLFHYGNDPDLHTVLSVVHMTWLGITHTLTNLWRALSDSPLRCALFGRLGVARAKKLHEMKTMKSARKRPPKRQAKCAEDNDSQFEVGERGEHLGQYWKTRKCSQTRLQHCLQVTLAFHVATDFVVGSRNECFATTATLRSCSCFASTDYPCD